MTALICLLNLRELCNITPEFRTWREINRSRDPRSRSCLGLVSEGSKTITSVLSEFKNRKLLASQAFTTSRHAVKLSRVLSTQDTSRESYGQQYQKQKINLTLLKWRNLPNLYPVNIIENSYKSGFCAVQRFKRWLKLLKNMPQSVQRFIDHLFLRSFKFQLLYVWYQFIVLVMM